MVIAIATVSLVLVQVINEGISRILWDGPQLPALAEKLMEGVEEPTTATFDDLNRDAIIFKSLAGRYFIDSLGEFFFGRKPI